MMRDGTSALAASQASPACRAGSFDATEEQIRTAPLACDQPAPPRFQPHGGRNLFR
jgi:hypothetical protein